MVATKKIECTIWGIASLIMMIIAVIHPRILYCILVIVCGIICITCYRSKKKKTVDKMCKDMVKNIIAILFLCCFGQFLNILFPYHASYEYKNDIASLKKVETLCEYYYFPDEIPDMASNVEWVCLPNFLQGTGYHKLFFYADESYLQEVYGTYSEYATIYTYELYDDQYASWANHDMKKTMSLDWFPGENTIEEQEKKNVKVLLLYDNQDANHPHNGGIFINQLEGYVCFFAQ